MSSSRLSSSLTRILRDDSETSPKSELIFELPSNVVSYLALRVAMTLSSQMLMIALKIFSDVGTVIFRPFAVLF